MCTLKLAGGLHQQKICLLVVSMWCVYTYTKLSTTQQYTCTTTILIIIISPRYKKWCRNPLIKSGRIHLHLGCLITHYSITIPINFLLLKYFLDVVFFSYFLSRDSIIYSFLRLDRVVIQSRGAIQISLKQPIRSNSNEWYYRYEMDGKMDK